jgi:rhodanese-related sulfurtransferase
MKLYFSFVIMLLLNVACAQISSKPITEVSQNELNNVILIDVRTPEEFKAGHLENARNINLYDENFSGQFATIDKKETIYVYCKMGGRSAKAQEVLNSLGYYDVVNLKGGYDAYKKNKKE